MTKHGEDNHPTHRRSKQEQENKGVGPFLDPTQSVPANYEYETTGKQPKHEDE